MLADIYDSKAWKEEIVDDSKMSSDARHTVWGLSTDSMVVFDHYVKQHAATTAGDGQTATGKRKKESHSVWPVLIFTYNLPPWIRYLFGCVFVMGLVDDPTPGAVGIQCAIRNIDRRVSCLCWDHGLEVFDAKDETDFRVHAKLLKLVADYRALPELVGMLQSPSAEGCFICNDAIGRHIR